MDPLTPVGVLGVLYRRSANLATATEALRAVVARSNNDPLGTSKVNDMRRIAENALAQLHER